MSSLKEIKFVFPVWFSIGIDRSCVELLLSLSEEVPDALWNEFKSSVQVMVTAISWGRGMLVLFHLAAESILNR